MPTTETDSPARTPVLGTVTDEQTYRNLLYLFLRFPLGIAYFTVLVTGVTLGVGLSILGVGFVVLALTIAGATYAGSLEALLANRLLGMDIAYEPHDPTAKSLVDYTRDVLTDSRSYVLLAYMLLTFPVGIASFVLLVLVVTLTFAFVAAPFTYWLPFTNYELVDFRGTTIVVDTLPEALLLAVGGLVVGVVGVLLCDWLARVHGRVTAAVLSQNR